MGAMDLGSMESSSRISWRDSELAHSVSMATRGGGGEGTEGAEGSEAGGELGQPWCARKSGAGWCRGGSRRTAATSTAARRGTSVETSRTRRNVESMSTSGSPRVDLSRQATKTMVGRESSTSRWSSAGFNG